MTRYEANKELVKILSEIVEEHKDLRFGQILANAGFIESAKSFDHKCGTELSYWEDEFYNEPEEVLERVKERI